MPRLKREVGVIAEQAKDWDDVFAEIIVLIVTPKPARDSG
jgi:hypothetical protein